MPLRPQTLPSRPTPAFTGARLDRAAKLRASPAAVQRLVADPAARAVFCRGDEVLVSEEGSALVRASAPSTAYTLLLGMVAGAPLFGVDLAGLEEAAATQITATGRLVSLREAGVSLARSEGGLAAYQVALAGWHRHHAFCPNCGSPTQITEAGLARRCPRCGRTHFPRTDPVVIMLVEHDDRLLLGRRPGWPQGRYSLLAGFVAPAETPEEAVVREVREESDIEAAQPRYLAAQPWPFPASLMLGFAATSDGGDPRCADGELEDVRWFARASVTAAAEHQADWSISAQQPDQLLLPPPVSIARLLIDGWLAAGR